MAANTAPIFIRQAAIGWANSVTAANTAKDAASGTVYTIATADATEGSYIDSLTVMPKGTNVATVLRLFLNNGDATTTAANNVLIGNYTMLATTNSETAALAVMDIGLDIAMPPGYRLLCTIGTAVAAGFDVTAYGGKY